MTTKAPDIKIFVHPGRRRPPGSPSASIPLCAPSFRGAGNNYPDGNAHTRQRKWWQYNGWLDGNNDTKQYARYKVNSRRKPQLRLCAGHSDKPLQLWYNYPVKNIF